MQGVSVENIEVSVEICGINSFACFYTPSLVFRTILCYTEKSFRDLGENAVKPCHIGTDVERRNPHEQTNCFPRIRRRGYS